jgi:hypothetical protein
MSSGTEGIELADLLWQLRRELSVAAWSGEHSDIRFETGPIVLELSVAVERSTSPGAKVRFLVLDAEASARRSSTTVQRITLTLHPRRPGEPDRSPLISGAARPGER